MKGNKIDQLFKDNTSKAPIAFNEAYWKGAEKLIADGSEGGYLGMSSKIILSIAILISVTTASIFTFWPNTNARALEPAHIINHNLTIQNNIAPAEINSENNLENITTNKQIQIQQSPTVAKPQNKQVANSPAKTKGKTNPQTTTPVSAKTKTNQAIVQNKEPNIGTIKTNTNYNISDVQEDENNLANFNNINSIETFVSKPIAARDYKSAFENLLAQQNKSEKLIKPLKIKKHKVNYDLTFGLGLEYGYFLANRTLSSELESYQNFRNKFENNGRVTNLGIAFKLGYQNWILSSGIYQTTYSEKIEYPSTLKINVGQDNSHWNIVDNWTTSIDSSWAIDSIYQGHWQVDTTWFLTQDSSYIEQWDSVLVDKEDPELIKNNGIRNISYVEIPLWFGRSFGKSGLYFDVQTGVAVGFLTVTSGSRYINYNVNGLHHGSELNQHQQVIWNAMLRAGVRFKIAPRVEAGLYPSLRYNLNSIFKEKSINQRYMGYGLSFGLMYKF